MSEPLENRDQDVPDRLFVVIGDPFKQFLEPPYTTDPRRYQLPLFKTEVSDEQFEREYRHKIKAFVQRDDAIKFALHCNLAGVTCPVYDRVGNGWEYNADETGRISEDII